MMAHRSNKFHTMQPGDRGFLKVHHYLKSIQKAHENYENVQSMVDKQALIAGHQSHSHHQHHRQISNTRLAQNHFHTRSQSQHHYNSMLPPSEYNNYYNLPHIDAAFPGIARPRTSPPPSPPLIIQSPPQQKRVQLDSMTVMRLGAELGVPIDAAPEMPPCRDYTIVSKDGHLYKIPFPQTRIMATAINDPQENVYLQKGDTVIVLGPSNEDRSKFVVCYKNGHIEIPHQYTQRPSVGLGHQSWHGH